MQINYSTLMVNALGACRRWVNISPLRREVPSMTHVSWVYLWLVRSLKVLAFYLPTKALTMSNLSYAWESYQPSCKQYQQTWCLQILFRFWSPLLEEWSLNIVTKYQRYLWVLNHYLQMEAWVRFWVRVFLCGVCIFSCVCVGSLRVLRLPPTVNKHVNCKLNWSL